MSTPTWDDTQPHDAPEGATGPISPTMSSSGAIPSWNDTEDLQEKYGSLQQQILAGAEATAGSATLGASRKLENSLGLTTPEAQALRAQANPGTELAGNIAGTIGLIGATGGVGGFLKAGAPLAAKIGALAVEGGILGAGNAVTDSAMGDPSLNAQKVISHVGFGMLLGGGGGLLFEGLLPSASKAAGEKIGAVKEAIKKIYRGAEEAPVEVGAATTGAEAPVMDAPSIPKKGVQGTSYQEIQDRVNKAKFSGNAMEMPQKAVLSDALSRVEMGNPVHPLQMDSLSNQRARDAYQTAKEMGDTGQALQQYEALQKGELVAKTANTIQEIAGESPVVSDAAKAGDLASEYFTKNYQVEKKAAGELVGEAKALNTQGVNHLTGAIEAMSDAVPQIGKMLEIGDSGVKVLPYKTSMGMTKQTYSAVKEAVGALEENPQNFSDLFNIRKGLENGVNMFTSDAATQGEIRALKASLMDYMQGFVEKEAPNLREGFKRYAINEQQRGVIEKVFGASVGTPEFGQISRIKPEVIGDRIFSNTASVEAAKKILPREQFNHILANWLEEAKTAATDKGAFSSNKFGSFLRKNQDALKVAFSDNPAGLQRLQDLTTIMRILPDAPLANPSGTAKSLINYLKESHNLTDMGLNALKFVKDKTVGKIQNQVELENLNQKLAGKTADYSVKNAVAEIIKKTNDKIDSLSKSALRGASAGEALRAAGIVTSDHYLNHVESIQKLSSDPHALYNHLDTHTQALYSSIPNITQSLTGTISTAVQFLNSKLPKPNNELLLSHKWEPSPSQKQKFNRYFNAVNDPVSALKEIKHGTLSNETLEALRVVHPHLLEEMQKKVMENLDPKKSKNLPYATKIALSKFLGQPLENSMLPSVIMANQMAYATPVQSQQAQGAKRSSVSGLSKLDLSHRGLTRTQELEQDKS
jgi:hypothetical protein